VTGGEHLGGDGTELALGVLTGRERARAVEHLQHCGPCRARIQRMAFTSDELLWLLPGAQPPPGFAARVTGRLRRAQPPARRSRRSRWLAAAALVLVAAAGLTGWGLRATAPAGGPAPSGAGAALRTAALIAPGHGAVGDVYLHDGRQPWMFTAIDLDRPDATIVCQLTDQAGRVITVGSFRMVNGDGYWGSPEPDPAAAITGARLITTAGVLVATATFRSGH